MTQAEHFGTYAAASNQSADRKLARAMGFSVLALTGIAIGLSGAQDARMFGLVGAFAAMLTVSACLGSRLAKGLTSRKEIVGRRSGLNLETWS
ncbi:hypothetical protein [Roseibium litorale]|uniref:Uncharacterized protein n=1 Tax=Roseibium litorale TaxID=2803841 RepID=A0ABR9CIN0_9HYPH|nr:hypothetical protein [Roseibium litorale]MBD8890689.1 hypothetical protein [Roseibium litorale]